MSKERAFIGFPYEFKDICLIYPPTNQDIIKVGYKTFLQYFSVLVKTQEDVEDELTEMSPEEMKKSDQIPTPFEYMLLFASQVPQVRETISKSIEFFTHQKPTFLFEYGAIVIGKLEDKKLLTDENFFEFQNFIRQSIGIEPVVFKEREKNPKIRYFKAKQRQRDRVKAKKSGSVEFITLLTSVCCLGIGITPMNIGQMTYAAVNQLIARSQLKETYNTDVQSLLAGADPKKVKLQYWMQDIKKEN